MMPRLTFLFLSIFLLSFLYALSLSSCKGESPSAEREENTIYAEDPLLILKSPNETGISFVNNIQETFENNITTNINLYNGGGLAVADINNDDLPDLYFINCNGKNALYLNQGNFKFIDITDQAGLASSDGFETAVTAADVNADGWLDFYVCRAGPKPTDERRNKLFINNQNLTFTERSAEYGLDDISASTGANFFDYDNDGDLDLYLLNYPAESAWTNRIEAKLGSDGKYHPQLEPRLQYDSDRLYKNEGGKFVDVSKEAGIWNLAYGLSVSVSDINRDGFTDIYVGNDFIQPDRLYINNQKGRFSDKLDEYFKHCSQHTMGTDLTDFDNDGLVDLFAADMLPASNYRQKTAVATNTQSKYTALSKNGYFEPVVRNVLQKNNGNNTFSDISCLANVYKTDWSWSGLLLDLDNDGRRDLYVSNGYRREVADKDFIEYTLPEIQKLRGTGKPLNELFPDINDFLNKIPQFKIRNFCFKNSSNLQFENSSAKWMTTPPSWSCGAVWADLDKDGDLDLIVNNLEDPAFVYQNQASQGPGNHYLQLKLRGSSENPFAVGASALIEYDSEKIQYQEQFPTRGIFSSVEHLLHFGVGSTTIIRKLTVRWPNGLTTQMENIPANQRLELYQKDANGSYRASICPNPVVYQPSFEVSRGAPFQHIENEFNDFENWPLNPWKVTELGPSLATGDVNGDGLDDFFIGNAFGSQAMLAIQQSDGTFLAESQRTWEEDKPYEDHGACFFDADRDGDLDLVVVSGGAEATTPQAWQSRLYINSDGKGHFNKTPLGALPSSIDVGGRIIALDYDNDGDNDLIIGGRVLPNKWPLSPRTVLLRNDRNRFTDVTKIDAPEMEYIGMVTDLVVTNLDQDATPEIVLCGEWTPIIVFKIINGKLVNKTTEFGLDNSNGIWFKLAASDLDGDGDQDLVAGNLGHNTKYTASSQAPLTCYAADFDNNSILDPLMVLSENTHFYPMVQKDVLIKHIPSLKKKFLYAKDYGLADITDVYDSSKLKESTKFNCFTLSSSWWENKNGKLIQHVLPNLAQIAPTQGIILQDFTGDTYLDILIAGNKYGMEVETGRCDAGTGLLLKGDGKGNFLPLSPLQSGFWANLDVRDLALLKKAGKPAFIIVANNNGPVQYFRIIK